MNSVGDITEYKVGWLCRANALLVWLINVSDEAFDRWVSLIYSNEIKFVKIYKQIICHIIQNINAIKEVQ